MKINNIEQPSFQGIYIIKGTGKKVAQATYQICQKTSDPIMQKILKDYQKAFDMPVLKPSILPKFYNCSYHSLTGFYGESQPLMQNIIVTNEHTPIVDDYNEKKYELGAIDLTEDLNSQDMEIFRKAIMKVFDEFQKNMKTYEKAIKKCHEESNCYLLREFVVKKAVEAKKILKEMLRPYDINPESIRVISADNVLRALEKNKFNCIDGSFIE